MKDVIARVENPSIDSPVDQPGSRVEMIFTRVPAHHRDSPLIGKGENHPEAGLFDGLRAIVLEHHLKVSFRLLSRFGP